MRNKRFFAGIIALTAMIANGLAQSTPTRVVKMPTEGNLGVNQTDYSDLSKGFFMAGEVSGGIAVNSGANNLSFTELSATGGYRFSEYLRVGIGIGARYYIDNKNVRYMSHDWGLPLFVNVRGNFIPTVYRNVVPFWSMDLGTSFPDGVMVRPTVGIRVGQERSAFVASIGYMGQNIRTRFYPGKDHNFKSFITLKLGYEF